MKKTPLILSLFGATLLMAQSPKGGSDSAQQQLQKFNQFYRYLNNYYVEPIDMEPLVEKAIQEMLLELDPHSAYINADDMKGVNENFEGEFSGIGVEFNVLNDTIIVVNTIVGGPAQGVGVIPNDRIIGVDGKSVVGTKQNDVPPLLRGERGTKVGVEIVRHNEPEPIEFIIERDNIPITTVDASYKLNPTTGYIKVNRFGETTFNEFSKAFYALGDLETLVLDLRGNGGGYLGQAVELANFFLPRNSLIVSTEGGIEEPVLFTSRKDGEFIDGNVVVLIDESSASASEIVAGAIQDWDRGVVMGQVSFGKGLVQRQFPLVDGSSVRVTVARYHTPSGRVIQRPYEKGKSDEYYSRHVARFSHEDADSLNSFNEDSPQYKTLLTGRTVYGGGGITPDIIIKSDTTTISNHYYDLIRKSVVNEFVISYLDNNRSVLESRYPTFEEFNSAYTVSPDMLVQLIQLGQKRGVRSGEEVVISKDFESIAQVNLKALLAQKLFTTGDFYRVVNENNRDLFPALDTLLNNWHSRSSDILNP